MFIIFLFFLRFAIVFFFFFLFFFFSFSQKLFVMPFKLCILVCVVLELIAAAAAPFSHIIKGGRSSNIFTGRRLPNSLISGESEKLRESLDAVGDVSDSPGEL